MIKAHKIRLNPEAPQEAYFYRASGVARFAWNWALEEYKRRKAAGQEIDWNEIKKDQQGGEELLNCVRRRLVPEGMGSACREIDARRGGRSGDQSARIQDQRSWGILQKVGRFFPSSKRCHVCGYIKGDLQLSDRAWKCPDCGAEHERDENGAINIEMEGVSLLAGSGYSGVTTVEFAASALKIVSM